MASVPSEFITRARTKLTRLETLAKQAKGARVSFPGSSKSHTLFSPPPPPPPLQAPGLFIMIINYYDDDDDDYYYTGNNWDT